MRVTGFLTNFVETMTADQFIQTVAGHEDDDFRVHRPEGVDTVECPLVSVWVCAYNHEKYIRECLEGVVSQKTTFTYEVIVTDDCSTDSTQAVILEHAERYPTLIRPILGKRNLYSAGRKRLIEQFLPLARGKYVSFCEGDDYWTYNGRLQALADFLETHPRHSMCFHAYRGLSEIEGLQVNYPRLRHSRNVGVMDLMIQHKAHFASLMGRTYQLKNDCQLSDEISKKKWNALDLRIILAWLNVGKVYGISKTWSVYRLHPRGIWTSRRCDGSAEKVYCEYIEQLASCYNGKYHCLKRYKDVHNRLDRWTSYRRQKRYFKAVSTLLTCFIFHPISVTHLYFNRYVY